jgi:hypothetical protein
MSAPTWTLEESDRLTAELVVKDGHHVRAASLSTEELVAILVMAHQRHVTRGAVAERIGWTQERLRVWARRHDCYLPEDQFPRGPLSWCTKDYYEQTQARKGFRRRPIAGKGR